MGKWIVVTASLMASLLTASTSLAGDAASAQGLRSITPIREGGSYQRNVNAADYFEIIGVLNSIDGNQVIIGDRQLTLAPGVGTHGMSQYNTVGANLNNAGQVTALELISDEPN
jgi:hypothetical protein